MADSWEDQVDDVVFQPPKKPSLNPNAATFSFNPGAATFAPTFAPKPAAPPPPPAAEPEPSQPVPSSDAAAEPSEPSVAAESTEVAGSLAEEEPSPAPKGPPADVESVTQAVKDVTVSAPEEPDEAVEDHASDDVLKKLYEELSKEDPRDHLNLVFIGHVDAGKSTIGGQILYLTGNVDERTIEKYEREAKEKNRDSWYMAYIMDTNEEERAKGKTVEVGRANFDTAKRRYTILDAPGHKSYVPNMIAGAAQADVGVLVISARKGEFETGFERGGQTREHAQLAKTLGVSKLVIVVNKMDDPSVIGADGAWSKDRYDEIDKALTPFLRKCGYNPKKDLIYLPISGLLGQNMKERVSREVCPWYSGGPLLEVLDHIESLERNPLASFRLPIMDRYRDMGTIVMGKSEAGLVRKGDALFVMPNRAPVKVVTIYRDDKEVSAALGGENLKVRVSGIEEDDISAGFVLSSRKSPVPVVTSFEAQLQILELLEHKAIFTAGYKAVLHIHSVVEECEVIKLVAQIDLKTKEKKKTKFVKSDSVCIVRIAVEKAICIEAFDVCPQLGRFTLRDEGRTVAIGKVIKLPKSKV